MLRRSAAAFAWSLFRTVLTWRMACATLDKIGLRRSKEPLTIPSEPLIRNRRCHSSGWHDCSSPSNPFAEGTGTSGRHLGRYSWSGVLLSTVRITTISMRVCMGGGVDWVAWHFGPAAPIQAALTLLGRSRGQSTPLTRLCKPCPFENSHSLCTPVTYTVRRLLNKATMRLPQ